MLRKRRVLPPDAGWFRAGFALPGPLARERATAIGKSLDSLGLGGRQLGPQLATGLVFFGFVVVLWRLADAGQAIIDRWNAADDTLPGPSPSSC